MKTIFILFCAVFLFVLTLVGGAYAADYSGYYVSFAYDKDGSGKPINNADGFPARYIAHFQFHEGGTYEGLFFGALTKGKWHKMTNQAGNELWGLTIEETTDKSLEETYGLGKPAFVFRRYEHPQMDVYYVLGQLESDELIYMDIRDGKLDVDKVLDEIQKFLSGDLP
jgi:hypothetical protein